MKTFVATDGTVFTDRALYRKHEMETQYTFRNEVNATLVKHPGSIHGQPFVIDNCRNCELLLLDHCDQVQIDDVSDSRIFIGASSGSIFVRNCKNCKFTVACKQFRTRDCVDCTIYLHSKTEPAIETSTGMKFGPFNGTYPGHENDMLAADLDSGVNKWDAVYDFSDPNETHENWRILSSQDQDSAWCPLGEADQASNDVPLEDKLVDYSNTSGSEQDSNSTKEQASGILYNIKVLGCRTWTIISNTVCSVQAFCLGLVFSGLQPLNKMISQS